MLNKKVSVLQNVKQSDGNDDEGIFWEIFYTVSMIQSWLSGNTYLMIRSFITSSE